MTDLTGNDGNTITAETDIPAGNWQEGVEFHAKALGAEMPSNIDVATLLLVLPDFTLQLNKVDDKVDDDKEWITKRPDFYVTKVTKPDAVRKFYHTRDRYLANGATSILEPHAFSHPGHEPLLLAYVGRQSLLDDVVCVIHNPNW